MSSAKKKAGRRRRPANHQSRDLATTPAIAPALPPEPQPEVAEDAQEAQEAQLDIVWLDAEAQAEPEAATDATGIEDASRPETAAPAEFDSANDIFGLMRQLDENFAKGWVASADPAEKTAKAPKPRWYLRWQKQLPQWWLRGVKSVLGLLVIVVVGWQPIGRLFQTSSVEAVVNARVVTLRAPIQGVIGASPERLIAGTGLKAEQPLYSITDPTIDRGRLVEFESAAAQAEDERHVAELQLTQLQALHARLARQVERFRVGRSRQLESQLHAYDADIAGAEAQRDTATTAHARAVELARTNATPVSRLEETSRDLRVAESNVRALKARRNMAAVERDALRDGTFIGDSYNDRPASAQRDDDVSQQIATLEAKLAGLDIRRARLAEELATERARTAQMTRFTLKAPVSATVWETLVSPGETVVIGQELLRLLDCSGAVVTATVSESVYNRLRIGGKARFIPADQTAALTGQVVQLTGVAAPAANLAIEPSSLVKEYYRVTVAVPALAEAGQCHVGRTGRIVFD
jgi:multidrug resistance efflux pump